MEFDIPPNSVPFLVIAVGKPVSIVHLDKSAADHLMGTGVIQRYGPAQMGLLIDRDEQISVEITELRYVGHLAHDRVTLGRKILQAGGIGVLEILGRPNESFRGRLDPRTSGNGHSHSFNEQRINKIVRKEEADEEARRIRVAEAAQKAIEAKEVAEAKALLETLPAQLKIGP